MIAEAKPEPVRMTRTRRRMTPIPGAAKSEAAAMGQRRGSAAAGRSASGKRPDRPGPAAAKPAPAGAESPSAPQKIHKVLAQAGLGSRREMEALIRAGRVRVNGEPAQVGMRVRPGDLIKVGRRQVTVRDITALPRIILYHKPEGEIVSRDDPQGRRSVFERLPPMRRGKWLAVGRLDYNTCGLLIFTSSGELANRLMHPRYEVEREYAVRIRGELSDEQLRQLRKGVRLTDGVARFDEVEPKGGRGTNYWYRVVLREGRNRIVRRMFEAVGVQVGRLMRIGFGVVALPPRLKRSAYAELEGGEVQAILNWAETLSPHPRAAG